MPAAAIGAGILGIAGGIAGAQKDVSSYSGAQGNVSTVQADAPSADEQQARQISLDALTSLNNQLNSLNSSPVLQNLNQLMQEMGQAPTQERIGQANQEASALFAPQQTMLNQAFTDQRRNMAQTAAAMGRSSSDPILAAKLAQEQVRQQQSLNSQQGAFAQQEAINMPGRQFQNQIGALSGLQNQAIQNRQAIYGLGSDFANTQMQYRLATATRTGRTDSYGSQESGGGFKGFMTGLMGGMGSGARMGNAMGF
jgi:hypothetical protein